VASIRGSIRDESQYPDRVRLLVVGGSGFLGREVIRQALRAGHRVEATFHRRVPAVPDVDWRSLDLRHRADVAALVAATRPEVIVNAAYRQADWATTADGAAHVALAAAEAGARLVHVSSDAVFSGTTTWYDETRVPDPITPYGAAKAAAETAIQAITPTAVIARTSLIIGDGDSPHERHVHALASGAVTGALFTDDVRCPVHVTDLAAAVLELATSPHAGIHHAAGADAISRYELGVLVARRDGLDHTALPAGLRAASGLAGPLDVRLDSTATQARLTTRLRGAREFLAPRATRAVPLAVHHAPAVGGAGGRHRRPAAGAAGDAPPHRALMVHEADLAGPSRRRLREPHDEGPT
jgi:dTDP-4-dehydrorhamnose reductase